MDETFNTFHRVLSFVGFSIFAKNHWESKTWLVLQTFNFIIAVLCFIFTSSYVISKHSDLILFIQGACIWTTGVIMTITLAVCLHFRKDFRTFLEAMAFKDTLLEMPLIQCVLMMNRGKKLMELKALVVTSEEKLLKYTRILLKSYVASVWLCATLYLCTPIYQMMVREDEKARYLAFDMLFPWSLENFKVYIASFIFHAYCGYLCCIAYPGFQSIIILLIGQIIRHLRVLTFVLMNLTDIAKEMTENSEYSWKIYSSSILVQCVQHYVKLKRFSNKLNLICRPFYLTLILVAIMLVCMCSVKIAISKKLSPDTMKYYVHEFCFILVVLMYCMLGQQVENESANLEEAVTEKWYIFDIKHKKNVLVFNMALTQRMPIYIFGTITLSLPTFTWFIRTGMSFFTLVMSVLEEND